MNLIIDIGNSVAKLAVFDSNEIVEVRHCSNQTLDQLSDLCNRYVIEKGILSSVITLNEECQKQLDALNIPIIKLSYRTPVPIKNLYQTPQTLGMDRLAAVVGANYLQPGKPLLVIDAGTCITYDFIDEGGQYQGGNISPGKRMRFKALHSFTDKLPEISPEGEKPAYGKTTETAIRSGVIRGIEFEIKGYISHLMQNYPELLVFLTGGDEFSFDTKLKNTIFADGFLVLKGLNRILIYNNEISETD